MNPFCMISKFKPQCFGIKTQKTIIILGTVIRLSYQTLLVCWQAHGEALGEARLSSKPSGLRTMKAP